MDVHALWFPKPVSSGTGLLHLPQKAPYDDERRLRAGPPA
jgi:hypothetical protein